MSDREAILDDLVAFARVEVESGDLEPWAAMLGAMYDHGDLDTAGAYWLVKLYNAYDDLGSAWAVAGRWPSVMDWLERCA